MADDAPLADENEGDTPPPAPAEPRGNVLKRLPLIRSKKLVLGETEAGITTSEERERDTNQLRRHYGRLLIVIMLAQVGFADWFLWQVASHRDWALSDSVMIAFMSSVVAEIIGLVLVITRSIFPGK